MQFVVFRAIEFYLHVTMNFMYICFFCVYVPFFHLFDFFLASMVLINFSFLFILIVLCHEISIHCSQWTVESFWLH